MERGDSNQPQWLFLLALLAGNCALALGPWFVRLADTGPVSAGFWRLGLAVPFLFLIARGTRQPMALHPAKLRWAVIAAGVIFALDIASWHVGIEKTRLANATLFGNSGSLVLMVWGFVLVRSWPRGKEWLAILCALGGAGILLGRSLEISVETLVGDLFCLLAGMFYAGYLLLLQDARRSLGGWSILAWSSAASAPVLLAIALLRGEPVWPTDWTPVIALFISSQLVGQGLLVFALRHFPPLVIGLALLTQPAVASMAGWLAFGEVLGPMDILGMVMLASALAISRATQPKAPSTGRGTTAS
ncbi:MAG: DMT family transporter [Sphingomonadaceae bacterium]|nr:DMT family transporter [Sphingomonadaceae bacterium]